MRKTLYLKFVLGYDLLDFRIFSRSDVVSSMTLEHLKRKGGLPL